MSDEVVVRRARIEEIRPLAHEYREEQVAEFGEPTDPPLPQGGIFWVAEDEAGQALGYAAGTMRSTGCTVGPVFARSAARRHGVGRRLLTAIQQWASDTRVPIVEISVNAANDRGSAFLQALGYRPRRLLMTLEPEPGQQAVPPPETA